MRARYATKAAIKRATEAARACGVVPGFVELAPDGTIRIIPAEARQRDAWAEWEGKL
jgi:hypothetical protein